MSEVYEPDDAEKSEIRRRWQEIQDAKMRAAENGDPKPANGFTGVKAKTSALKAYINDGGTTNPLPPPPFAKRKECPKCGTPYGKRTRCYRCPGKAKPLPAPAPSREVAVKASPVPVAAPVRETAKLGVVTRAVVVEADAIDLVIAEVDAMKSVAEAVRELAPEARSRVLGWVAERFPQVRE